MPVCESCGPGQKQEKVRATKYRRGLVGRIVVVATLGYWVGCREVDNNIAMLPWRNISVFGGLKDPGDKRIKCRDL